MQDLGKNEDTSADGNQEKPSLGYDVYAAIKDLLGVSDITGADGAGSIDFQELYDLLPQLGLSADQLTELLPEAGIKMLDERIIKGIEALQAGEQDVSVITNVINALLPSGSSVKVTENQLSSPAVQALISAVQAIDLNSLRTSLNEVLSSKLHSDMADGKLTLGEVATTIATSLTTSLLSQAPNVIKAVVDYLPHYVGVQVDKALSNFDDTMTALVEFIAYHLGEGAIKFGTFELPPWVETVVNLLALGATPEQWETLLGALSLGFSLAGGFADAGFNIVGALSTAFGNLTGLLSSGGSSPWVSYETVNGVGYYVFTAGPLAMYVASSPKESKGVPVALAVTKEADRAWRKYVKTISKSLLGIVRTVMSKVEQGMSKAECRASILAGGNGVNFETLLGQSIHAGKTFTYDMLSKLVDSAYDYVSGQRPADPVEPSLPSNPVTPVPPSTSDPDLRPAVPNLDAVLGSDGEASLDVGLSRPRAPSHALGARNPYVNKRVENQNISDQYFLEVNYNG